MSLWDRMVEWGKGAEALSVPLQMASRTASPAFFAGDSGLLDSILPLNNPPQRSMREWLQFLNRSPILRMVIYRIARDLAAVRMRLYRPTRQGTARHVRSLAYQGREDERRNQLSELVADGAAVEITDHPYLEIRGRNMVVNGIQILSGHDLILQSWVHFLVLGEAYWLKGRSAAGVWTEALLIPPPWVRDTPRISRPRFELSEQRLQRSIEARDMVWARERDPADTYGRGRGAAHALGDDLEMAEMASGLLRHFFQNDAVPRTLVTGNFTREEIAALRIQWLQTLRGWQRHGTPHFIGGPPGSEVRVDQLGSGLEAVPLDIVDKVLRFVRLYFGLPPTVVGDFTGGAGLDRSGVQLEESSYGKRVLVPLLEADRALQQREVEDEYDKRLLVMYDPVVDSDYDFQLEVMGKQPGAFTVDEWRDLASFCGLEDDQQGASYLVPSTVDVRESLKEEAYETPGEEPSPPDTEEPDQSKDGS